MYVLGVLKAAMLIFDVSDEEGTLFIVKLVPQRQ
jgi:hypothetical protein